MPQHTGVVSSSPARIEALKAKHSKLEQTIHAQQQNFSLSDQEMANLKREKLRVKEEIEGIRRAS